MHTLLTIVALLIVLGVVVFVHELGHFLAARWAGVRVDTFSIGFEHPHVVRHIISQLKTIRYFLFIKPS